MMIAFSFATNNAWVENQTFPSHEPSAQAQSLFLRKQGSGSQRRKLPFHSKYNFPPETSVLANSWTVNLLQMLTPHSLVLLLFLCNYILATTFVFCIISLHFHTNSIKDVMSKWLDVKTRCQRCHHVQDGICFEWDFDDVMCPRCPNEPSLALKLQPTQCDLEHSRCWMDGHIGAIHGNNISKSSWWFTTNNAVAALMDN